MRCEQTYELLAAYAAGDLDPGLAEGLEAHARGCDPCRRRLAALAHLDEALKGLRPATPSAGAVLETRRALRREIAARAGETEIMSLDQVAEFLRIDPGDLEAILGQLPAFEIAGQLRVRRAKLIEWIEQREVAHRRRAMASEFARQTQGDFDKGVA